MQELEALGVSIAGNQLAVESSTIEQIIEVPLYPAPPGSVSAFSYTAVVGDRVVVVLSPSTDSESVTREADTVVILRSAKHKFRVGLRVDKVGRMMLVTPADSPNVATDRDGGEWLRLGDAGLDEVLETGTFDHLVATDAWLAK